MPATDVVSTVVGAIQPLVAIAPEDFPALDPLLPTAEGLVERLCSQADGVRDLALILTAYSVTAGRPVDFRTGSQDLSEKGRLPGDRQASDSVKDALRNLGIQATSPLQNSTYRGGYFSPQVQRGISREFLRWLSEPERSLSEITLVFEHLVQRIAATANRVPALPDLDRRRFVWWRTISLFDSLLDIPSGGAIPQYLISALLDAILQDGPTRERAYTKPVLAADRAANAAGDIEVRLNQNLVAVIEVANRPWQDKVRQSVDALRSRYELEKSLVLAEVVDFRGVELEKVLQTLHQSSDLDDSLDVAVLDLRTEIRSMVARASKRAREESVRNFYRLLVQHHAPSAVVEATVHAVKVSGLAIPDP